MQNPVPGLGKVFGLDNDIFTDRKIIERILISHSTMGVRQGVAMDSLKFHPGPPSLTLLRQSSTL
jgi:hypothetical protein